jgi:hemerythrin-like domain-containing protein
MSKAIDDLKHEHEAILSALKILDTINDGIAGGTKPDK